MKTKTRLKRLDMRGFSHDIGIVLFAMLFAIVGVGYLVASHADECTPVSGATSEAVTVSGADSSSCEPVSGAVSSGNQISGTCTIVGIPAATTYGQQLTPLITYTNTGNQSFVVSSTGAFELSNDTGGRQGVSSTRIKAMTVNPGQTVTIETGLHYTATYGSDSAKKVTFTATNDAPAFSCAATAVLPGAPVRPTPPPAPARLSGACNISGVPARPAYKQVVSPYVTVTNTGTGAFQPKLTQRIEAGKLTSPKNTRTYSLSLLKPKTSVRKSLAEYKVPRRTGNTTQATIVVTNDKPSFRCVANLRLP